MKTIAEAITEKREAKNLSKQDLAKKAGLHLSYISIVEGGKRQPSPRFLNKVGEVLGDTDLLYLYANLGSPRLIKAAKNITDKELETLLRRSVNRSPRKE